MKYPVLTPEEEQKRNELWENVKQALIAYIDYAGEIEVEGMEYAYDLSTANFSEPGYIDLTPVYYDRTIKKS